MHLIKRVEITNFRSIQHEVINCSAHNLFCGLNDVGKSNVLKALNLFFNGETDFMTPLDFSLDYNKISLAKATRSDKQKQQIKIKITFHVPQTYRSLSSRKDFSIEKVFDRYGKPETKYSEEEKVKKTSIARLHNRIRFVYIPALKGEAVIQYLLGLIGEYQLVEAQAIDNMNSQINNSTKDLSGLLQSSNISTGAFFGLPTLLRDFWQKLSVNTSYEQFSILDQSIEGTAKDKSRKLNPSNYQIPLTLRGEGIKSKYIPPLLQWLQQNNKSDYYIWGIDEPENSLEFRASEYLSTLFCNEYALTTQIFGTTHSMAFINPPDNAKMKPTVFRCVKTDTGATSIRTIEDLLKDQTRQELLDELGVLEIQKHIIEEFREKIKELDNHRGQVATLTTELRQVYPEKIFICEDEDAVVIWDSWFSEANIVDVTVKSSKGCTTNTVEETIKELRKIKPTYQPRIFRQLDRDGYTDDQISAITEQRERSYGNIGTYKVSFLPVNEIENFVVLSDPYFTGTLLESKCDELLLSPFFLTAKSNIRSCHRKWNEALFKENEETKMWIAAKADKRRYLPGKDICKFKANHKVNGVLRQLKYEDFPQELNDYLTEIKNYFDSGTLLASKTVN